MLSLGEKYTPRPADGVFCHTTTLYGYMIGLAELLRFNKGHYWRHMAIVVKVDPDGTVWCLQMKKNCNLVKLQDVAPNGGTTFVVPCPPEVNREMAVAYAYKQLGIGYAWFTILNIAINIFVPRVLQLDFTYGGALICSGLVARSWEHGSWNCVNHKGKPINPFNINPAEMWETIGSTGYALDSVNFKG